jgi:hypothetical protein
VTRHPATFEFLRRFVPRFPLLFFPQRATGASLGTMTKVLTSSLATRRKAAVPFDSRIVSPSNIA